MQPEYLRGFDSLSQAASTSFATSVPLFCLEQGLGLMQLDSVVVQSQSAGVQAEQGALLWLFHSNFQCLPFSDFSLGVCLAQVEQSLQPASCMEGTQEDVKQEQE